MRVQDLTITQERHEDYVRENLPYISIYPTRYCSHNCWYCCSGKSYNYPKKSIIDELGVDLYISRILSLSNGVRCEYRPSGGEPLEHPATPKIIEALLNAGHNVCLGTNGVHIDRIIDTVNGTGKKIDFEVSFHIGQYLREKDGKRLKFYMENVVENVLKIGKRCTFIVPIPPEVLHSEETEKYFDQIVEMATAYGANLPDYHFGLYSKVFSLSEFGGEYNGKTYPRDYSVADRERITYLMRKYVNPDYAFDEISALSSINRSMDLKGINCYYMTGVIQVSNNGDIFVCGSGDHSMIIGNIRDANISSKVGASNNPAPCAFKKCCCASMGLNGCLKPHGLTFADYDKLER